MAITQERFVEVVRELAEINRDKLDRLRTEANEPSKRDIWTSLVRSMATMGRSAGWKGLEPPMVREPIAYERLIELTRAQRVEIIERVLRAAKVRMAKKKAAWLAENVDILRELGGPVVVERRIEAATARQHVIDLLLGFRGIGPKYARNLPVDQDHPAFRDSIAIDVRIKSIGAALGVDGRYGDVEAYYLGVAREAGLDGWLLDRLLYNFTDDVLGALVPQARTKAVLKVAQA